MKILGIEHIGVAVKNISDNAPFWNHILGLNKTGSETVKDQGVKTDIFNTGKGKIELLEALDDTSPIAKYLDRRGPGIHHVCLQVEDITTAIKELKDNNIQTIGDHYTTGSEGYKIIFIHPKTTGGVLVELAEKPEINHEKE
ncbi:MAG: methylmalonyl-CoA epimerase [Candidatus Marinimicrobia bacterium]|jgi:methylmalonyl-CoA epimerase|nr:methylmalonyl-CoA epimerase [Candidatus Neomarinimicrobiota bacterium]MBT3937538.1 methylmalonyl-CoA epimerase [Candidatus Neomarinimicrobiota bacterium]MBT3961130.1 methylmalonyl-CoA epimerase [Candidatus Neomarinimicrobiota bacterium]MBT4384013.1 methylmalonyl-CoA epimerase [Candidatus Neomarinimicrobiota bacterium]MBT4636968.1 methylmalonyl-CoA epimerase [Candidatus Neomarinimicrobiota bacterium]